MNTNKLLLILLNIPMIGRVRAGNILRHYQTGTDLIRLIGQLYPFLSLTKGDLAEAETASRSLIQKSEKMNIRIFSFKDPAYPLQLRNIGNFPLLIFVRGNPSLLNRSLSAALIGSRRSDSFVLELTDKIGELLASRGVIIISGLALGCDRVAHGAALRGHSGTIAVMPCGPDIIYPRENEYLYRDILRDKGTILTEYGPGTYPAPFRFVDRNRLQSGLSHMVVLMESSLSGGAMHTALSALRQNRPLLVFNPEKFTAENSGNQYLIEEKNVYPFQGPEDFLDILRKIGPTIRDCNRESDQLLFPHV